MSIANDYADAPTNWAKSFAHRQFKSSPQYLDLTSGTIPTPVYASDIELQPREVLLGVYEYVPGQRLNSLVITDQGLFVARETGWTYLRYCDIVGARMNLEHGKAGANSVVLTLTSGQTLVIPAVHEDVGGISHFIGRTATIVRRTNQE